MKFSNKKVKHLCKISPTLPELFIISLNLFKLPLQSFTAVCISELKANFETYPVFTVQCQEQ